MIADRYLGRRCLGTVEAYLMASREIHLRGRDDGS
jgi:hypothetical protein